MMDYSTLSDFEISKAVAELKFGALNVGELFLGHKQSCAIWPDGEGFKTFDLNNPSDAWQIIIDNHICIELREGKTALARQYGECPYEDVNPLRAAMIVFLMLNEK